MNLAFALTGTRDGLKSLNLEQEEAPVTHDEITKSLNIGFVREFNETKLHTDVLREFVFALDHLNELVKTANYPNNRLLNTPDISETGSAAVCTFNDFAKRAHEPPMYGCAVGEETTASIEEFLKLDYPRVISSLLKVLKRDSVMCTLDLDSVQISLKPFTPHPEFGLITFNNYNEETVALIPFHLTRITDL